jgi:predicted DNA-binding transcriptional regulator AlpA
MRDPNSGMAPLDTDRLLRPDQAAALLNMTPRTLEAWRHRGGGPPYVRISGRAVRYRRGDLLAWAGARVVRSTAEELPNERL